MNAGPFAARPRTCLVVVLLNWNGGQHTITCLESLAGSETSAFDLKIVVVDNASTDGSRAAIAAAAEALPIEVTLLDNPTNLGFAGGCNPGLRWAIDRDADYVLLLNNDTRIGPGALDALVATAEATPRVGAVGALLVHADGSTVQAWGGGRLKAWLGRCRYVTDGRHGIEFITGACMLLRVSALASVGLLDERYFFTFEDVDLSFRLRDAGWKLAVADGAVIVHADSATVGTVSRTRRYHFARGLVLFLRDRQPLPVAVVGSVGGLIDLTVRDLLKLRWSALAGVLTGWVSGWKAPRVDEKRVFA